MTSPIDKKTSESAQYIEVSDSIVVRRHERYCELVMTFAGEPTQRVKRLLWHERAKLASAVSVDRSMARIEVRRVGDKVRLEVSGASPDASALIQQFVGALNGRTFDPRSHLASPAFSRPIRLDDVGLDEHGEVGSVTLEADVAKVVLQVDDEHERRAAAFCQRHRHTTTTEALDDLAAEFERVAREASGAALRRAATWCSDQSTKEGTTE